MPVIASQFPNRSGLGAHLTLTHLTSSPATAHRRTLNSWLYFHETPFSTQTQTLLPKMTHRRGGVLVVQRRLVAQHPPGEVPPVPCAPGLNCKSALKRPLPLSLAEGLLMEMNEKQGHHIFTSHLWLFKEKPVIESARP